ncbi:MAG: (Fe-S)-binding protein [Clostridia bacterium]|nr:(Fe-S)-binding protein [Clostridia bacterium]
MYSEMAKKHADACRFCWMCRYLCPVGLATGKEVNTPRARGLLVSLDIRGQEFDESCAEAMYECCLCGACTHDCVTGYEPPIFIREARTKAVVNELVPAGVQTVIDSVLNNGNIFSRASSDIKEQLDRLVPDRKETAEVLFYIGGTALVKAPHIAEAVIRLFKCAGIDYTILADEPQSGTELGDLIGYVQEVVDSAKQLAEQINATKADKIVVLDPSCARVFKQEYPRWGCDLKGEVLTATAFIAQLIREKRLLPDKLSIANATFHDPCKLARDLDEVLPAREIIAAMGIEIKEMFLNKKMSKCCGTELLSQYSPVTGRLIAQRRWDDAVRCGAEVMITACPGCYDVLKSNAPEGKTVEDLFVLLAEACKA